MKSSGISLQSGSDAVAEIPTKRWDTEAYYDSDPEAPGKIYTRYAGLLDQIDQFDASLFGIAPREAREYGSATTHYIGSRLGSIGRGGCRAPNIRPDQDRRVSRCQCGRVCPFDSCCEDTEAIDTHFGTGTALNAIAGRLAFHFRLWRAGTFD